MFGKDVATGQRAAGAEADRRNAGSRRAPPSERTSLPAPIRSNFRLAAFTLAAAAWRVLVNASMKSSVEPAARYRGRHRCRAAVGGQGRAEGGDVIHAQGRTAERAARAQQQRAASIDGRSAGVGVRPCQRQGSAAHVKAHGIRSGAHGVLNRPAEGAGGRRVVVIENGKAAWLGGKAIADDPIAREHGENRLGAVQVEGAAAVDRHATRAQGRVIAKLQHAAVNRRAAVVRIIAGKHLRALAGLDDSHARGTVVDCAKELSVMPAPRLRVRDVTLPYPVVITDARFVPPLSPPKVGMVMPLAKVATPAGGVRRTVLKRQVVRQVQHAGDDLRAATVRIDLPRASMCRRICLKRLPVPAITLSIAFTFVPVSIVAGPLRLVSRAGNQRNASHQITGGRQVAAVEIQLCARHGQVDEIPGSGLVADVDRARAVAIADIELGVGTAQLHRECEVRRGVAVDVQLVAAGGNRICAGRRQELKWLRWRDL